MGSNNGKFYNIVKTNTYFGDLKEAIDSYKTYADAHAVDIDAVVTTETWQGEDADAAKLSLTHIEVYR